MPEQIDSRRSFIKGSLAAAVAAAVPAPADADEKSAAKPPTLTLVTRIPDARTSKLALYTVAW